MSAVVQSVRQVIQRDIQADAAALDPQFAYLRITRGSQVGMLWRGAMEATREGPIEVYYSGTGEVVRLQDGRVVGALGVTTEWRSVVVAAPAWDVVFEAREPTALTRVRDVMPGYRSGVRDELVLRRVGAPERTKLRGVDPGSLVWFEETMQPRGAALLRGAPSELLPPARYALDGTGERPLVVYSEQCLAPDFCFTWQRWSAAVRQAAEKQGR